MSPRCLLALLAVSLTAYAVAVAAGFLRALIEWEDGS